ncbi:MAG TPA: hypothetical protein VEI99_10225 [Terriglobales bacterium]|nr:hypothetical protein [Terriglobales bacterium]
MRNGTSVRIAPSILNADANPDFFLEEFVAAGSDSFLLHWKGDSNLHRTVEPIRALGKRAGVAINPATPASVLEEILPDVNQALVMTVDPGFGHQPFLHSTLPKIRRVFPMLERIQPEWELGVDEGMDEVTAPLVVAAGANVLAAGSSIFASDAGVGAAMETLRAAVTPPSTVH